MFSERLKQMLDRDTADEFLELSPLCGMAMEYGDIPRAGLITGMFLVHEELWSCIDWLSQFYL